MGAKSARSEWERRCFPGKMITHKDQTIAANAVFPPVTMVWLLKVESQEIRVSEKWITTCCFLFTLESDFLRGVKIKPKINYSAIYILKEP